MLGWNCDENASSSSHLGTRYFAAYLIEAQLGSKLPHLADGATLTFGRAIDRHGLYLSRGV